MKLTVDQLRQIIKEEATQAIKQDQSKSLEGSMWMFKQRAEEISKKVKDESQVNNLNALMSNLIAAMDNPAKIAAAAAALK